MKTLKLKKRGAYKLNDLAPLAILFVVAAIVISFGAKVLSEIDNEFTAGTTEDDTVKNGSYALLKIGKWLPTLAIVAVAAVIIGLVVSAFYFGR